MKSHTHETKTNTTHSQKEDGNLIYNRKVKERLDHWLRQLNNNGYDLDFKMLAAKMQLLYNLNTSEQKLRHMFDITKDREVKLAEIVALAHMLQIPLGDLCEFPNTPAMTLERPYILPKSKLQKQYGIRKLFNEYYNGKYYGYYFRQRHLDRMDLGGKTPVSGSQIKEVSIEILVEKDEPYVVLRETEISMDFYNQRPLDQFTLKGKLYLIENQQIAYSFITDPSARRAIALMFEYKDFSKDILYYRTAAMLTFAENEKHVPLFQKIALFRVQQDLNDPINEDIVRGILSLNTGPIMVEKTLFDQALTDPAYSYYKLNELTPKAEKTYYIFSEPALRDSDYNWTAKESVEILLKLREMSIFPAHEIVIEPEYFRNFILKHQQEQLQKLHAPKKDM